MSARRARREVAPPLVAGGPDARAHTWADAGSTRYDVVVVGGGISGASVARDAALRGLRVLLIERGDIGSGTSSGSTKLAHGGFRYLQQGHFRLVRTACLEREILRRIAPHLVQPLRFLFPSHPHGRFPSRPISPFLLHLGLTAYDVLSGSRGHRHRMLRAAACGAEEPLLRPDGVRGAALYDDASLDDARLTLAITRDAAAEGALVWPRVALDGIARDARRRVTAVQVRDAESGATREVATRSVVLACGPWGDEARLRCGIAAEPPLRLTQGVHVVVPFAACPVRQAVVLTSPRDGRLAFAVPWSGVTLIGTTDSDVAAPHDARVSHDDVDYLLETVAATLPSATLGVGNVQGTSVAVRPLVGRTDGRADAPSDVPREHAVLHDGGGVFTLAGGKLTTARAVAEETADAVAAWLSAHHGITVGRCRTASTPLVTAAPVDLDLHPHASRVSAAVRLRWRHAYGSDAWHLLDAIAVRPALGAPVDGGDDRLLVVEVVHAVRHEWARDVEDVVARRTRLLLLDSENGCHIAAGVARVMGDELGWDAADRAAAVARYLDTVATMHAWRHESERRCAPH